jgi:hypothetical protein
VPLRQHRLAQHYAHERIVHKPASRWGWRLVERATRRKDRPIVTAAGRAARARGDRRCVLIARAHCRLRASPRRGAQGRAAHRGGMTRGAALPALGAIACGDARGARAAAREGSAFLLTGIAC